MGPLYSGRQVDMHNEWLAQKDLKVVSLAQSKNKAMSSEAYNEVLADMRDEELFGKAAAQIQSFEKSGYQE